MARRGYRLHDSTHAAEISLSSVRVPGSAVLGEVGNGLKLVERVYQAGIAAVAAEAVGAMETLHTMTVEYLKTRVQSPETDRHSLVAATQYLTLEADHDFCVNALIHHDEGRQEAHEEDGTGDARPAPLRPAAEELAERRRQARAGEDDDRRPATPRP